MAAPAAIPHHVTAFAHRAGIATHKLRWCHGCWVVAFAIDDHQRDRLDELGFNGGHCPEHQPTSRELTAAA